jgi:hypothetical protein
MVESGTADVLFGGDESDGMPQSLQRQDSDENQGDNGNVYNYFSSA